MSKIKTPRHGHAPLIMCLVTGCSEVKEAGNFYWDKTAQGRVLVLAIPHNNKLGWVMSRWTIGHKNECDAQWSWDGNVYAPTLKPSLHAVGVWHGWVKQGMLVEG